MTVLDGTVPYPWPYDGCLDPARLALVLAGAQAGWAARSRRAADVTTVLLAVATELRALGAAVVVIRHAAVPGRRHPVLPRWDEAEWRIPFPTGPGDLVVDATGLDGFHGSGLDDTLRARGIDHLVVAGFGHEAAVDSTLRSANDRGYECLILSDGVAPFDDDVSAHALASVTMSGGIFGAVGDSTALLAALGRPAPTLEVVP